ncbi:methylated-DNA--[protein]-cysteine S-methyltransferase [Achromobacter animicus]|uniref:methylated-DNA--[protein]-cysteine S-methyltransferase n=1 Tax=Achromobacter animicus TaxID=1389935 RepID=UPI002446FAF2|nr:methylated-DNA--[protein]-cysteine S-methyltransferase [Achromobacter animicus]MDH0681174.1 methylated-DNA--[protein]-cysteine S-methyltransferase [Achromobacter animicus]
MPVHTFLLERVPTPIGRMLVLTDAQAHLRAVDWEDYESRMHLLLQRQYGQGAVQLQDAAQPSQASRALQAYFDGDVNAISDLPVAFGGTRFQQQVWHALRGIEGGSTISYGTLATRIARPTAVRAVGLANGANPVGIVIPCHRVIGANATLTGYGGGLHRKRWLLAHEAAWRSAQPSSLSSSTGSALLTSS